jgi:hypothetical protein
MDNAKELATMTTTPQFSIWYKKPMSAAGWWPTSANGWAGLKNALYALRARGISEINVFSTDGTTTYGRAAALDDVPSFVADCQVVAIGETVDGIKADVADFVATPVSRMM